jgi:hypothetical protein
VSKFMFDVLSNHRCTGEAAIIFLCAIAHTQLLSKLSKLSKLLTVNEFVQTLKKNLTFWNEGVLEGVSSFRVLSQFRLFPIFQHTIATFITSPDCTTYILISTSITLINDNNNFNDSNENNNDFKSSTQY